MVNIYEIAYLFGVVFYKNIARLANNQLQSIADAAVPVTSVGDVGNSSYAYDAVGQLAEEHMPDENNALKIKWTPYAKTDTVQVYDNAGTLQGMHRYLYDGMGNQVRDIYTTTTGTVTATQTSYNVYDGHNVQLAAYKLDSALLGTITMQVQERYVYGSERAASIRGTNALGTTTGGAPWVVGPSIDKAYELHDHLGNVRATFSSAVPGAGGVMAQTYYNYYAFGSQQPHRSFEPSIAYTSGFNGQERKDDYMGAGNENHALYWEYETRIGRRWNIDPVDQISISNYAVMANSPIWKLDPLGDVVKTDQEGAENTDMALKGILDGKYNPIKFIVKEGEKIGKLVFDEAADLSSYTNDQKDVLLRYKKLIDDESVTTLHIVDALKDQISGYYNKTLQQIGANGATQESYEEIGGKLKITSQEVYVARNPMNNTKSTFIGGSVGENSVRSSESVTQKLTNPTFAGITNLHEMGGTLGYI